LAYMPIRVVFQSGLPWYFTCPTQFASFV